MKTYMPSNSTDGEAFMDNFCYNCTKEKRCNILIKALTGETVKQWVYNPNPMCLRFKKVGTKYKKRQNIKSDNQKTLF